MSLAQVLNQIESLKDVCQIENNVLEKCKNCSVCNKKISNDKIKNIPIQNMERILDVNSLKCSPRQYKASLVAACKKIVSQMVGAIRNMKSQSNSLVFLQGGSCCSNLNDVIDTYHIPRQSNLSLSSSNINDKKKLEIILSNSRVDSIKIDTSCNVETNISSKIINDNNIHISKTSLKQLQNDTEVRGLYPLLSFDDKQDVMCNIEPLSCEEQVYEEIQQSIHYFKQFDSVCGAIDHHFVNQPLVRNEF